MKVQIIFISLFSVLSIGCGPTNNGNVYTPFLEHTAGNVRVIKTYPAGCRSTDVIEAKAIANAPGSVVWTYAMNDLRNKASRLGVNTVVLEKYQHSSDSSMLTIRLTGRALVCGTANKTVVRKSPVVRKKPVKTIYESVEPTAPPKPAGNSGKPEPVEEEGTHNEAPSGFPANEI